MDTISIKYTFTLTDNTEIFDIKLNAATLDLIPQIPVSLPQWVELDYHQCPNCSLLKETHPFCPLAVNVVSIINRFEHILSHENVHIKVVTKERTVSQDTTAQRGISSLMGLIIATSGCPDTVFFKPMARFHLPFASEEETIFRTASVYMLTQYFLEKDGKETDFELKNLKEIYQKMSVINSCIAKRLRSASSNDSVVNAIILLDMYAKTMPYVIEESLDEIRYLFDAFLKKSTE